MDVHFFGGKKAEVCRRVEVSGPLHLTNRSVQISSTVIMSRKKQNSAEHTVETSCFASGPPGLTCFRSPLCHIYLWVGLKEGILGSRLGCPMSMRGFSRVSGGLQVNELWQLYKMLWFPLTTHTPAPPSAVCYRARQDPLSREHHIVSWGSLYYHGLPESPMLLSVLTCQPWPVTLEYAWVAGASKTSREGLSLEPVSPGFKPP